MPSEIKVIIESYKDLIVWQRSIEVSLVVYRLTSSFPKEEMFGLTSQMRRAAISIPSNIAEGSGRNSKGEYRHFSGIARGATHEVETELLIASKLGYAEQPDLRLADDRIAQVSRMLRALISKL